MASGGDNLEGDDTQQTYEIALCNVLDNVPVTSEDRRQQFSTLITSCNGYTDICGIILNRVLQGTELALHHPHMVRDMRNDFNGVDVMFGAIKMTCELVTQFGVPESPGWMDNLRQYCTRAVEFTKEVWRKMLTCRDIRSPLLEELKRAGEISLFQMMVDYVCGKEEIVNSDINTTIRRVEEMEPSSSSESRPTNQPPRASNRSHQPPTTPAAHNKDGGVWHSFLKESMQLLKCIALIGGMTILGAAGGALVGGLACGPVGLAVGASAGAVAGAMVGTTLAGKYSVKQKKK